MKHGKFLLATGLLFSMNTYAALYDRDNGLVYDSDQNITWAKDANLFQTLGEASNDFGGFVQQVIDASNGQIAYSLNDSGYHSLDWWEFNSNGQLTWFAAQAFVGYLNSSIYKGYSNWRLPSANGINLDSPSETGYINNFHLANPSSNLSDGSSNPAWTGVLNSHFQNAANGSDDSFLNLKAANYWTNAEYDPDTVVAYNLEYGFPTVGLKNSSNYVWVVRPGDVAAVPVPGAIWLFGSAILGFAGVKRRKS